MSNKVITALGAAGVTVLALAAYVAAQTSLSLILTGDGLWFAVTR